MKYCFVKFFCIVCYDLIDSIKDMGKCVIIYRFYIYGYDMYFFLRGMFRFMGFIVWFLKDCYYLGFDYVGLNNVC